LRITYPGIRASNTQYAIRNTQQIMQATIADITADRVFYRDLEPCDPHLPRLRQLAAELGLTGDQPPRKRDPAYARVALALAQAAQRSRSGPELRTLVVIGDTANDRLLAEFTRSECAFPAYCFIGADRPMVPEELAWEGDTATATRWELLHPWAAELDRRGFNWPSTALLIDIDKTLLGPRGRSDGAIDDARAEGALTVAGELLGPDLPVAAFRRNYADLCHFDWHGFTLDNQDYVTATALLTSTGAFDLEDLRTRVAAPDPFSFADLLDLTAGRTLPALAPLHAELSRLVTLGDPTPFKAFRRAEFRATLERMADGRLTIGSELLGLAHSLAERGALIMAASDKPAESALPTPEQAAAGMLPLHRAPAVVG
jgi:hypothetical protein